MPDIITLAADGGIAPADADKAGAAAKGCKVVAFPTESSYALGSTGLIKAATRRLLQMKERSTLKPLPVMVSSVEEAKKWVEWTPLAEELAKKLWPGPAYLLLRPTQQGRLLTFPEYPTVAIRVPSHPAARAMMAASGVPWIVASANKSGSPALADFALLSAGIGAEADILVDGGAVTPGEASIIDATGEKPRVVKAGLATV
jgi:L-threonylcarbamoyladenylate synthase